MNPETETRRKLLNKGYKFIRLTEDGGSKSNEPKIKICETYGVWRTYKVFETKAARDREAERLIREEKCLCLETIDRDICPVSLYEQDGKTWIRIKTFDEDFLLDTKDMTDKNGNKEFTWQEAMDEAKRQGYELMSHKQGALVSAYLEEVKKINEQAHGDSLDNPYWTGARYGSYRAWCYTYGDGRSRNYFLCIDFYARLLAYPIKKS